MSVDDPPPEETPSQREWRSESGRVLPAVGGGRPFRLADSAIAVGRIVPLDAPAPGPPDARLARRAGGWAALVPKPTDRDRPIAEIVEELREDRL